MEPYSQKNSIGPTRGGKKNKNIENFKMWLQTVAFPTIHLVMIEMMMMIISGMARRRATST